VAAAYVATARLQYKAYSLLESGERDRISS
jgi:hypothetical protein